MKYQQLLDESNSIFRRARAIHRIVQGELFCDLYDQATPLEQEEVKCIILTKSLEKLKEWIEEQRVYDFISMNYLQLREAAQQRKIPLYYYMNKDELLMEVKKYEQRRHDSSGRDETSHAEGGSEGELIRSSGPESEGEKQERLP